MAVSKGITGRPVSGAQMSARSGSVSSGSKGRLRSPVNWTTDTSTLNFTRAVDQEASINTNSNFFKSRRADWTGRARTERRRREKRVRKGKGLILNDQQPRIVRERRNSLGWAVQQATYARPSNYDNPIDRCDKIDDQGTSLARDEIPDEVHGSMENEYLK